MPPDSVTQRDSARRSRHYLLLGVLAAVTLGGAAVIGTASASHTSIRMSPIERLVAEDEIRQQIALSALLADGDGIAARDVRRLADTVLTRDAVADVILANGSVGMHTVGRDELVAATPTAKPDGTSAGRHYVVSTYFDELTPASARTRTTALYLNVTRNAVGADCAGSGEDACGGKLVRAVLFVYHDTWAKTPSGWQKTRSELRRDT